MLFIPDFVYDPNSGRPIPPQSWFRFSCQIWCFRIMALMAVMLAAAFLLSDMTAHLGSLVPISIVLLTVSELTAATLRRRRATLAEATRRYEAMIAHPFD